MKVYFLVMNSKRCKSTLDHHNSFASTAIYFFIPFFEAMIFIFNAW